MSRSLSRWQAALLGVVVLGALALGAIGVFAVGSRQWLWSDTFHLRAGFAQVRGVEVGTRVRVQGVEAGEVDAIQVPLTPNDPVIVRVRLDSKKVRHLIRADASAQIVGEGMVGGHVLEIHPGSTAAPLVQEDAIIATKPTPELGDVLAQVNGVLQEVRSSEGTLGKLMKDDQAYRELLLLLRQGKGTLASIQQDADALKRLPLVRNYVKDAQELLVRPDCERNRQSFAEAELFETGQATLTAQGRQKLDKLVPWLEGLKHKNSEVVIASYADPGMEAPLALTLSQKQSDAVCAYLKDQHAVQKMGWFSRSRKVTPIGLGVDAPPNGDKDKLPAPRVEVLVFVPRS